MAAVAGKITILALEERKHLIYKYKLEDQKYLRDVCPHKYYDNFQSDKTGSTDFHCLVCNKRWTEDSNKKVRITTSKDKVHKFEPFRRDNIIAVGTTHKQLSNRSFLSPMIKALIEGEER